MEKGDEMNTLRFGTPSGIPTRDTRLTAGCSSPELYGALKLLCQTNKQLKSREWADRLSWEMVKGSWQPCY